MVIMAFIMFGIYILIGLGIAIIFERYGDGWKDDGDILAGILFWPITAIILIVYFIFWIGEIMIRIVRKAGGRGL